MKPMLEDVAPGMPASRGGLKEGDVIVAVDGQPIQWWGQFTERVRGSGGKALSLDIERKGQPMHLVVTPQAGANERGETRLSDRRAGTRRYGIPSRGVWRKRQICGGARRTKRSTDTIGVVGKLFSGRVSVKQLQSVVGISRAAGQAVHKGA